MAGLTQARTFAYFQVNSGADLRCRAPPTLLLAISICPYINYYTSTDKASVTAAIEFQHCEWHKLNFKPSLDECSLNHASGQGRSCTHNALPFARQRLMILPRLLGQCNVLAGPVSVAYVLPRTSQDITDLLLLHTSIGTSGQLTYMLGQPYP